MRVRRAWKIQAKARGEALTLVGLLVIALLSGCGGWGTSSDGGSEPSRTPEPTVTPRTGPAETRRAVAYSTVSPKQTLDLYLPAGDGSTVYPLVVLIHGGGFHGGDSGEMTNLANLLSTKGFATASINYRLSGEALFPAGVQDVAAGVRYLRANARSWGVDPRQIAVWGESAGGYLASMVGASTGQKRFEDDTLGNPGVSSEVQAVVSWFGPSDFATMDEQAKAAGCDASAQQHHREDSPESRWLGAAVAAAPDQLRAASVIRAVGSASSLPPYFLVHGERDCTVASGQSVQLKEALDRRSARVTLTLVPGSGHADQRIIETQTRQSIEFLRSVFGSKHPPESDGS